MLGFGFVEVGTVTAHAQPGNEPPRLWRVLDQRALRNRMGFNNEGSAAVAARLRRLRATPAGRRLVVGVNIGKTKVTPGGARAGGLRDERGPARAVRRLPRGQRVVAEHPGSARPAVGRGAAPDPGGHPRGGRRGDRVRRARPAVPLLVKIAPDLSDDDVDAVAELAAELGLDGIVAVNTTIGHDLGPGGLSGPPVLARGLDVVARLRNRLGPDAVIIGVGGITTAADAREYVAVGATLVQGYTGLDLRGSVLRVADHPRARGRRGAASARPGGKAVA